MQVLDNSQTISHRDLDQYKFFGYEVIQVDTRYRCTRTLINTQMLSLITAYIRYMSIFVLSIGEVYLVGVVINFRTLSTQLVYRKIEKKQCTTLQI